MSYLKSFSSHERALVAIGVLLDGHEAAAVLAQDCNYGAELQQLADELAGLPPEFRMPYLGSVLRMTLAQMHESND